LNREGETDRNQEVITYAHHHIMELRRDHGLCSHELGNEPIIFRRRHVLPWP
jgi:hypothetical protein